MSALRRNLRQARLFVRGAINRGNSVECPCCGGTFRRFLAYNDRPAARCPRCDSAERHRAQWLYMRDEMHLGDGPRKILHFAPEVQIARRLAALPAVEYITADLAPGNAMEQIDMTDIPKPDGSFDLVIVNHVLEHIPDDRAAIAEIARILRPGGIFLTMHPVMETATTFEDETIVVPEERLRHFGQEDHVRVYGQDFVKRLTDAGFSVDVIRYSDEVASPADRERYGLVEQLEWVSFLRASTQNSRSPVKAGKCRHQAR